MIKIAIGGHLGVSYSIERVAGNTISYEVFDWGRRDRQTVAITEEAVQQFEQTLMSLNVNYWQERYIDPRIYDGTSWTVKIKSGDVNIKSGGTNAYPDRFDEFCSAVETLLGGLPFR